MGEDLLAELTETQRKDFINKLLNEPIGEVINMSKTVSKKERKEAFENVFNSNFWGNRANAGKDYKRPYCKTTGEGRK